MRLCRAVASALSLLLLTAFAAQSTNEEGAAGGDAPSDFQTAEGSTPLPRTEWGPRPTFLRDGDDGDRVGQSLTSTFGPPSGLVASLRQRLRQDPEDGLACYFLGRALLLDTTAGAQMTQVVLSKLPTPSFDVELTENDASKLHEAQQFLTRATVLLPPSNAAHWRAKLSLGWALELESQTPDGSGSSAVEAINTYLAVAEDPRAEVVFSEAMAYAQQSYRALPFYRRWPLTDVRDRLEKLGQTHPLASPNVHKIAGPSHRRIDLSPLVIPLDGQLDPRAFADDERIVHFPLDPYHPERLWSWVTPRAALLVWDPMKAGRITSGAQLFGDFTWLMVPPDGFAALSLLDVDGDGWVRGKELQGLRLWIDANSNGQSEPGEVVDLETLGVEALATRSPVSLGRNLAIPKGVRLRSGKTLPLVDWYAIEAQPWRLGTALDGMVHLTER